MNLRRSSECVMREVTSAEAMAEILDQPQQMGQQHIPGRALGHIATRDQAGGSMSL